MASDSDSDTQLTAAQRENASPVLRSKLSDMKGQVEQAYKEIEVTQLHVESLLKGREDDTQRMRHLDRARQYAEDKLTESHDEIKELRRALAAARLSQENPTSKPTTQMTQGTADISTSTPAPSTTRVQQPDFSSSPAMPSLSRGSPRYPFSGMSDPTQNYVQPSKGYAVPMPRQNTYDGKSSWESFIVPFRAMANQCNWDGEEKLFRITNSLRGEAADYVFAQLGPEVVNSYELLVLALEGRFKEKRSAAAYLAQLEARKLSSRDEISVYIADIRRLVAKGFPTADATTREVICLRYFVRGLNDQQMALHIGMQQPRTIEQAREAVDQYHSLQDELYRSPRARVVQPFSQPAPQPRKWFAKNVTNRPRDQRYNPSTFVTEERLQKFGDEIKGTINQGFEEFKKTIQELTKPSSNSGPNTQNYRSRNMGEVQCYKCYNMGHYARDCVQGGNKNRTTSSVQNNGQRNNDVSQASWRNETTESTNNEPREN